MKNLYHGSSKKHKVGSSLKARTKSRLHFGQIEKVLESYRPDSVKNSRLTSIFMVDSVNLVRIAGGDESYVFKVEGSDLSKHHMGWFSRILSLFPGFSYSREIHLKK